MGDIKDLYATPVTKGAKSLWTKRRMQEGDSQDSKFREGGQVLSLRDRSQRSQHPLECYWDKGSLKLP